MDTSAGGGLCQQRGPSAGPRGAPRFSVSHMDSSGTKETSPHPGNPQVWIWGPWGCSGWGLGSEARSRGCLGQGPHSTRASWEALPRVLRGQGQTLLGQPHSPAALPTRQSTGRESSACVQGLGLGSRHAPLPMGSGPCNPTIRRFVSKNNTALLGAGVWVPCQIRMLKMNITQPRRPARVLALPWTGAAPTQHGWGQPPPPPAPARCGQVPKHPTQSAGAGTPLPGQEVFLRQSNFASWLQGQPHSHWAANTPCSQPSSGQKFVLRQGAPSPQLDTKCKRGSFCVG